MKIPVVKLTLPQRVIDEVSEVLKSGSWVDGAKVKSFEENFAAYCGVKHSRGVSNGTTALMTIMGALGIGPGDEVIIPSFSFIATANCVKFVGATPIFADIVENTFNMDPEDVKQKITAKTKAIMPVHLFGLCADMNAFEELCVEKNLWLIEDACQAHGAAIGEKKAGSFGRAAAFSLYPTKNMFAGGEGGLITTNDEDLYEKIRLFMNHGQPERYKHTTLGYNFRLAEINATIAQYSLEKLDVWNEKRRHNAKILSEKLKSYEDVIVPSVPENFTHAFHQYTIRSKKRDRIVNALKNEEIGYGIFYPVPIHKQKFYQEQGYQNISLPISEKIANEVLSLPIHPLVNEENINFIAKTIEDAMKES